MAKRKKRGAHEEVSFTDEELQAWERQPRETEKAWIAFQLYRDAPYAGDAGIGARTQRLVTERLYPSRNPTITRVREVAHWSTQWRWIDRCTAYDRHLDAQKREAFAASLRADAEQNIRSYRAMRNKGNRALLTVQPDQIAAHHAARMVDMAITGLRREAGLATEITGGEREDAFAAWLTAGNDEEGDDADTQAEDDAGCAAREGDA